MKTLKKTTLIIILLLVSTLVFGQDTETRDLRSFTDIKVSEGIELVAEKGTENSITIETRRLNPERVLTEVRGDQLNIHIDNSWYRRTPRHNVRVTLTYTEELERIHVNTAADALFKSIIKSKRLDVSSSTSGTIELQAEVEILDLSASTSGRIEIEGTAEDLEAGATTGATIYAYNMEAKDVSVRANTGADIRVSAEDYLTGRAGTGGSISYRGRPRTSIRTNTGGSIRRAN